MIRMRHRTLIALAALASALPAATSFAADSAASGKALLEAVPADAWAVLMVPSLKSLDSKLAMLGKQLQMPIPPVVAMAQGQLGLGEELDTAGGLALVMMDFKTIGPDGVVVLMPTTNADALIKKLAAAAPAGGEDGDDEGGNKKPAAKSDDVGGDVTKCAIMGQPCYAAKKGNFVAIGRTKEACLAVAKSKNSMASAIEKQRAAAFAKADVILTAAASTWLKEYDEQIKGFTQMMSAMAGPEAGASVGQIDQMLKMLGQIDSVDMCLAIDESGVGLVGMGTPKSGSEAAKMLAARKPVSQSLLQRLPKEDFAFTAGGTGGAKTEASDKDIEQGVNQMLGMMHAKEKIDAEKVKAVVKEANGLFSQFGDSAFSLSVLQGGDGIIGAAMVIQCKDPSDAMSRMGKLVSQIKGLSDDEEFKKVVGALNHQVGADEMGGSKIDQLSFDISKLGEGVEPEDAESIKKVLGKEGFMLRFGPAGADHLAFGVGGGKSRFAKIVDAAKSDSDGLGSEASIQRAQKHLPAKKTGEFYLAVDSLADGVQRIMTALDEPESAPFKLGKVNAPVAGATSVDATSGRLDLFVPMELITSIKDAAMAAQAGEEEDEEDAKPAKGAHGEHGDQGAKKPTKSDDDE